MIFRYLKGQPKLGLWYPIDSPFDLEAFSDSDYARASLDRKSTIRGCQFLGKRLISWQCKKQTIVANSTTEAEYVAAANCCGQNPVFHSKTKHIEIRHHFIRDSYEKKLIQVIKIHTDQNVADLLTKAFDVSRVKTVKAKDNTVRLILVLLSQSDETVHKELGDRMEKAATTVSSLEAEQDSVDGKTMVISESSVRSDLHFNDEDGITCLSNAEIFVNLALMGDSEDVTTTNSSSFICQLFQSLRRKTPHSQLVDQKFNSFSAKSFSEDVRQLILRIDKVKFNHPILNMLLDKVKSDVYML
ncbi:hypothetical protein Tco_1362246 [Tanacetum coccineum]